MPEPLFPPKDNPRLRLRCITPGDLATLAALPSPGIGSGLASESYSTTPALMDARVESVLGPASRGGSSPCVFERRTDAAMVGWIVLRRDPDAPWSGPESRGSTST